MPDTVAMVVLELLHVPPPVASVSDMVEPTHPDAAPVIDAGPVVTATVVLTVQPSVPRE